MSLSPLRLLSPSGQLIGGAEPDLEVVRTRYADMVTARVYDRKASALQRQGRLATYAAFEGQEACQIGAVAPLEPRDWVVATYRDAAAMHGHGYPWWALLRPYNMEYVWSDRAALQSFEYTLLTLLAAD